MNWSVRFDGCHARLLLLPQPESLLFSVRMALGPTRRGIVGNPQRLVGAI